MKIRKKYFTREGCGVRIIPDHGGRGPGEEQRSQRTAAEPNALTDRGSALSQEGGLEQRYVWRPANSRRVDRPEIGSRIHGAKGGLRGQQSHLTCIDQISK